MAVVNLGQFGSRRESRLSGVSDALAKGIELKETRRRTDILEKGAETDAKLANLKSQQLRVDLAKEERVKEEKQRALANQTRKNISLRLMGKTPSEQQIVLESEQIKEITKTLIKPVMPEAVDPDSGLLIPERLEFFPKTAEEARQVKEKAQEGMDAVAAKKVPTISSLEALRSQVLSTAWMLSKEDDPETQKQLKDIDTMYEAALRILKDANPNVFTNSLGGGAGVSQGGIDELISEFK